MARAQKFTRAELVSVAVKLAGLGGPRAVTMQGVAESADAASGSVYHRFEGRADLLAAVWLDAVDQFQRDWWTLAESRPSAAELAVFPVRWSREHSDAARILLLHSAGDFLGDETPPEQRQRARELQAALRAGFRTLSDRFLGSHDEAAVERTMFVFSSVPLAAIRGRLASGARISRGLEHLVAETARALLGEKNGVSP